jgi:protein TonB
MRSGIVVSLLLHAAAILPLLFMLAPRIDSSDLQATIPARFIAQTVNIESLRPEAPPVVRPEIAPLPDAPVPVTSEAEQAVAVAPIRPERIEPTHTEPPPEPVALQEPETLPAPVQKVERAPETAREPPPEEQTAEEPEPLAEPEPPAELDLLVPQEEVEPQPPQERLAMAHEPAAPGAASPAQDAKEAVRTGTDLPDPDYLAQINALLESNKQYPYMAQRLGIEGEVDLWFELNPQGEVLDYQIDEASGQAMLYEEVERLIQETAFPPFPPDFNEDRLSVKVRISFHLMS